MQERELLKVDNNWRQHFFMPAQDDLPIVTFRRYNGACLRYRVGCVSLSSACMGWWSRELLVLSCNAHNCRWFPAAPVIYLMSCCVLAPAVRWLQDFGGEVPTLGSLSEMPPAMSKEETMDRYLEHTRFCPHCQQASMQHADSVRRPRLPCCGCQLC